MALFNRYPKWQIFILELYLISLFFTLNVFFVLIRQAINNLKYNFGSYTSYIFPKLLFLFLFLFILKNIVFL